MIDQQGDEAAAARRHRRPESNLLPITSQHSQSFLKRDLRLAISFSSICLVRRQTGAMIQLYEAASGLGILLASGSTQTPRHVRHR